MIAFAIYKHRSSGPLRGLKRDIWEGGHRVPFIVRWPGVVRAGSVSDELMSQIDIMATIAAVVDFDLPASAADDSHNQLALWKGGTSARKSIVHNTKQNHYAVREGNHVLIDAASGKVSGVPPWFDEANGYKKNPHPAALYDLSSDLSQAKNLYEEQPDRVKHLKELLSKIRAKGEVRSSNDVN